MSIVLDTNVYVAWQRGDARVVGHIQQAEQLLLPVTVLGELLGGFRGGTRLRQNVRALRQVLDVPGVRVLNVTLETADRYGRLMAILRRRGRPIPPNDAWIAAVALERRAPVLSFDRHFAAVPGLAWIDPARA